MNGDLSFLLGTSLAFAKDEIKPRLRPSAKQRQNPCSESPPQVFPRLSGDWGTPES